MSDDPNLLHGQKRADRRVRVTRPESRYFRYVGPGVVVARPAAIEARTPVGRALLAGRRALFGRPLATAQELDQRLPKWQALPVFSSDAMSSVAYGPEAAMYSLLAAGTVAFSLLMPMMGVILVILLLITLSYRQTIRAYPNGGGSYIVAHANLGQLPGLVAAAALLTDYVLTVSVSVSAGVFNLASAFPALQSIYVELIVALIFGVMILNLRGIRESGSIIAWPTYIFLGSTLLVIAVGVARVLLGDTPHVTGVTPFPVPLEALGILLVMRAFANGCSALTGTEAVANGVPAFKPPESRNAQTTMVVMSILLGTMLVGIAYLAIVSGAVPSAELESVLSQVGRATVGRTPLYYILQISTMGILVIAAQTSFADFPRVSAILAKDGYFPRSMAFRGERLAFGSGIVLLAIISSGLVVFFGGHVESLIPLYALGVYTAFTLSQAGMVHHWFVERSAGWRRRAVLNGLGALATGIVVIVFAIAKFTEGAWIIIVVVPLLVALMLFVHRQYARGTVELTVDPDLVWGPPVHRRRVIIPVFDVRWDVIQAVRFGRSMTDDITAVHVTDDVAAGELVRGRFERQLPGIAFVIVESPYRNLVDPLIRYLEVTAEHDPGIVTVVLLPERVTHHWWEPILFNQNVHRIREALTGRSDILVADVPFRSRENRHAGSAPGPDGR